MKIEIKLAASKQDAVTELEKETKYQYSLILGEKPNQITINIGQKLYYALFDITHALEKTK